MRAPPCDARFWLRWIARVWGAASIAVLVLFVAGEGLDPGKIAAREWVGFLFFPIGIAAGMIVAWWREGLGGAITLLSLIAFYGVYGLLMSGAAPRGPAFLVFAAPGALFLLSWIRSRRTA